MSKGGYIIDDEPSTGQAQGKWIVDPQWPLLAVMMAGVWMGWPWLLYNGWALGSPSFRRQARLLAVGLLGTVALAAVIVALLSADIITTRTQLRLALLLVTVWKLGISYRIHALQRETFELYLYYAGSAPSGLRALLVGALVGRTLVLGLFDSALWVIIVSMLGTPW